MAGERSRKLVPNVNLRALLRGQAGGANEAIFGSRVWRGGPAPQVSIYAPMGMLGNAYRAF